MPQNIPHTSQFWLTTGVGNQHLMDGGQGSNRRFLKMGVVNLDQKTWQECALYLQTCIQPVSDIAITGNQKMGKEYKNKAISWNMEWHFSWLVCQTML